MNPETFPPASPRPTLKEPTGWFAAGRSFRQALTLLSDGAFKLFAYICLEADRRTGRFETTQRELAQALGNRGGSSPATSRSSATRGFAAFAQVQISLPGHSSRWP